VAEIQYINADAILKRNRAPLTDTDVDSDHAYRFSHSNMTFDKNLELEGKYCYHPFNTVTIDTRGECFVCVCQAWLPISVGNILDFNSLTEIVHSPRAREIQASILDGTYKYCDHNTCHLLTRNGLELRISHRPDTVNWIVFAIDDSCNLTCPSCRTGMIFHNKGEGFDQRMRISAHITKLIQEHHQFLRFTLSGDGDPFASHVYRHILENLKLEEDDPVEIEIVTNGILAKSHWDRMSGIHNHVTRFKISFDAGTPETYAVTRRGGDWDKLIESSEYIINWKQKYYSKMEIVANFVVQNSNYRDIHKYVELTKKLGFDEISLQKVVDWGKWETNGINYFADHAVWMESHPNYQDLINSLQDPIMQDPKIQLTNLSQMLATVPPKLSNLVKLRKLLRETKASDSVDQSITEFMQNINILKNHYSMYDKEFENIFTLCDELLVKQQSIKIELDKFSKTIREQINEISISYNKRGYIINGSYGSNRTGVLGEVERSRALTITDSMREFVISKISQYASWQYPGLEIGPGEGTWTSYMVACDPLYLVDIYQEFFNSTLSKFNNDYQKKICTYITKETDLSMLPQGQFGFIFSWNVFNYLTLDLVDQYLSEIFLVLRPGGVCFISYNDGDSYIGAKNVETGYMSYVPFKKLEKLLISKGFEILSRSPRYTDEVTAWIEFKKPGELHTIKQHPTLGIITNK